MNNFLSIANIKQQRASLEINQMFKDHTVALLFLKLSNSCVSLRLLQDTRVLKVLNHERSWCPASHVICFLYEKLIICSPLGFTFLDFSARVTVAGSPQVDSGH